MRIGYWARMVRTVGMGLAGMATVALLCTGDHADALSVTSTTTPLDSSDGGTILMNFTLGQAIGLDIVGGTDGAATTTLTGGSEEIVGFGTADATCLAAVSTGECVVNTNGSALVATLDATITFSGFGSCSLGLSRTLVANSVLATKLRASQGIATNWALGPGVGEEVDASVTNLTGCTGLSSGGHCIHQLAAEIRPSDGTHVSTPVDYTIACVP